MRKPAPIVLGLLAIVVLVVALIMGNSDIKGYGSCGTQWAPKEITEDLEDECEHPGSTGVVAYMLLGAGMLLVILTVVAALTYPRYHRPKLKPKPPPDPFAPLPTGRAKRARND